jgi:hypothetical protein
MNSASKINEEHDKSQEVSHKSGDGDDNDGSGDDEEEVLISEDEMRKLKEPLRKLTRGMGSTISVDEALIIAKSIKEDPMFSEEEVFDIINSEEVNETRRITEEQFIFLIEVIKKKQNQ